MLINCPRCGFQQPQDKYCAQCGVDMETYKPSRPPVWKRFFGNLAIQLSLLVFIAGGVGVVLYKKGQQNLERRAGRLYSPVQINQSSTSPASSASSDLNKETSETNIEPTPEAASKTEMADKEVAFTEAQGHPTTADKTNEKAKTDSRSVASISTPHLEVYYAEVSRRSLNNIVTASRTTGQFMNFNDYTAGILPNIEKFLSDSSVKVLTKEIKPVENAKTLQWFYGIKNRQEPDMEIGLTTFFEISEIEGANLRGNFEIQRTWREQTGSGFEIQRKAFPAIFEIGAGTGFFMAGVMPLQSNLENDDELMSIDVYKILRSTQFRSSESEFVIFIKFEKGN